MASERVEFEGHEGDRLAARLDRPDGPLRATALFAHCFTCGKDVAAARRIAAALAARGVAVLRFDFTGLGHSDGEFGNTGFTSNVMDLVQAARFLDGRGMAPAILIGHSLGGAAVLAAAGEIASVKAVATIGAPSVPAHVLHNFEAQLEQILADGSADVTLGGRTFKLCKTFVVDVSAAKLTDAIAHLRRALLILHAPRDAIVGIENAAEIFTAARHPKSFVTLDDADHLLTRPEDADYAADVIAAWAGRYITPPAPAEGAAEDAPEAAPDGVARVIQADPLGFRAEVRIGPRHRFPADEPVAEGGEDTGPGPYALLTASLGTCTAMTLRDYARRKGWPLETVTVDVTHETIANAKDAPRADRLTRTIRIEGALDDAQRARLIDIASRCPVSRTLEGEVEIVTRGA